MYNNLILTVCNESYSQVLFETIQNFQQYATKTESDLSIISCGDKLIDKYVSLSKVSSYYEKVCFIDSDMLIHDNAPNVFNIDINNVAAVPVEDTLYRRDLFKSVVPILGCAIEEKYYAYSGTLVAYNEVMLDISKKCIELWDSTPKSNDFMLNDEVYLCQVLKLYYPDFTRLEENWVKTMTKILKGQSTYFSHTFVQGVENKKNLIKEVKYKLGLDKDVS